MVNKISGIYYILNKSTNQIYIGKSENIMGRLSNHFSLLRNHNHYNRFLQQSFNEYGENKFEKGILKVCKKHHHDRFEKLFIRKYNSTNPNYGFNIVNGNSVWDNNVMPLKKVKLNLVNGKIQKEVEIIGYIKPFKKII